MLCICVFSTVFSSACNEHLYVNLSPNILINRHLLCGSSVFYALLISSLLSSCFLLSFGWPISSCFLQECQETILLQESDPRATPGGQHLPSGKQAVMWKGFITHISFSASVRITSDFRKSQFGMNCCPPVPKGNYICNYFLFFQELLFFFNNDPSCIVLEEEF